MDLQDMRRVYARAGLDERDLAATWPEQFAVWLSEAVEGGEVEANATVFATADTAGRPSARTVLLKSVDARGFVVYTNLASRKGREAAANPHGSLVFPWLRMQRQVTVVGTIEPVTEAEADEYFASRPHGSRLGALASPQSQVIPSRDVLERALADLRARYPEGAEVPRPAHWGGVRLVPDAVEFWQGRPNRLHDRLRYRREADGRWVVERLAP